MVNKKELREIDKEFRYLKRIGELARATGLMIGFLEGICLDSRIPFFIRNRAEQIKLEAKEILDRTTKPQ